MKERHIPVGPPLGGVRYDLNTDQVPPEFAIRSHNTDISRSTLSKASGFIHLGGNLPLPGIPIGLAQFSTFDGNLYTVACTLNDIYRLGSSGIWESIKGAVTWDTLYDFPVSFMSMNNKLIMTQAMDRPVFWDGVSPSVSYVPNTENIKAHIVDSFMYRAIYLNIIDTGNNIPQRVMWTKAGTFDDFISTGAGFTDLVDTPGKIKQGKKLGEFFAIYKEDCIIIATYIGGTSIFSFNTRVVDRGLVASRAVVDMGGYHLFMSHDNIYSFRGEREPTPIGDPVVDAIFRWSNTKYLYRSLGIRCGEQAIFVVPMESEYPDQAFVYNVRRKTWTTRKLHAITVCPYLDYSIPTVGDMIGTIGDTTGRIGDAGSVSSIPEALFADAQGKVYRTSSLLGTDDGDPIFMEHITGDFTPLDEDGRLSYVRFRYIAINGRGDNLRVEYSTDDGQTWKYINTLPLGSKFDYTYFYFDDSGNRIRFKFVNNEPGQQVFIRGYAVGYLEGVA